MNMSSAMDRRLTEAGLARLVGRMDAVVQPSIPLLPMGVSEAASTRIGGRPNLHQDRQWPEWNGVPLAFIAQLDLDTLPSLPNLRLPPGGALYFFHEGGNKAFGSSLDEAGSAQIIHDERALDSAPLREFPLQLSKGLRFVGQNVDATRVTSSFPMYEDPTMEQFSLSLDECCQYAEAFHIWTEDSGASVHRCGGYTAPEQGDPKYEAEIATTGIQLKTMHDFARLKAEGSFSGVSDWCLLLQVASDATSGMMWGDLGKIYFLIKKQDLEKRAFEKAWAVLQCG